MSYANQALVGQDGTAVNVQAEFAQTGITLREIQTGEVVVVVKCVGGHAVADVTTPNIVPPEAIHVDVPPLTSGHEPKAGPSHAKAAHGDK